MLLEAEDLVVGYGGAPVVKGVSFHVAVREIVGVVGESGSGKSTLAKTVMGLVNPVSGRLDRSPSGVQMIFQDAVGSLNPRMTVRQTLEEVLKVKRIVGTTPSELLAQVGLSEAVLSQYPREMSGGQCQRVSVARALAARPQLLVADEPVSALDVSVQARVLNLLRDLRAKLGLAILLIAHDLAVVKNVCDRVYVMERGVFVDEGAPDVVFTSPKSPYTRRLISNSPIIP